MNIIGSLVHLTEEQFQVISIHSCEKKLKIKVYKKIKIKFIKN